MNILIYLYIETYLNKNKSYQEFRVPNLRNEVYRLFGVREKMLKEKKTYR